MTEPILRVKGLNKSFGAVHVLHDVDDYLVGGGPLSDERRPPDRGSLSYGLFSLKYKSPNSTYARANSSVALCSRNSLMALAYSAMTAVT